MYEQNSSNEFNFEQVMNQIKFNSPVRKVNFDIENKQGVVGMAIACNIDNLSFIKPDIDGIKDDTILFFNQSHIAETIQIIHAMFIMLSGSGIIDQYRAEAITDYILARCCITCRYKTFSNKIDDIGKLYLSNTNMVAHMMNNILHILKVIWFVPYDKLDKIYEDTIEEFKKNSEGNNNYADDDN